MHSQILSKLSMTDKLVLILLTTTAIHLAKAERFTKLDSDFKIKSDISSRLINLTDDDVSSEAGCLIKCHLQGCAAATFHPADRLCQLLFIVNASGAAEPQKSHVTRVMKAQDAGSAVWRADNFVELAETGRLRINYTVVSNLSTFVNVSTGRLGSIQLARINATGCYQMEAIGAAGGIKVNTWGSGARMSGKLNLAEGAWLSVVVGQRGEARSGPHAGAGGGGGSFVYSAIDKQLLYLAAGGGGGASSWYMGRNAETRPNGTDSYRNSAYANFTGFGGANGQPGFSDPSIGGNHGGCGAGWLGRPVNPRRSVSCGEGGGSLADGWVGGRSGTGEIGGNGGFGGGGGGGTGWGAGGGGGGFSGGGSGMHYSHSGGGGGSFCGGVSCSGSIDWEAARGARVEIQLLSTEPICAP